MFKISNFPVTEILIFLFFSSCNEYQKILNNDDLNLKYKAAENYYDNGEYRRANRIFEQLIPSYRGKPQAERLIYFFADSYYQIKNFYLAAYQFENFIKSFPESQKIEEANFYSAKSHYMMSPVFSLDQEETLEAINNLQIFLNNYSDSRIIV